MAPTRLLTALLFLSPTFAQELEISRPVRTWEFLDALGPKAGILGREDGTLEFYSYPLKIVKDLRLQFRLDGRLIPAEAIARRIVARPGSYTIFYSGDEFEVRETLAVSPSQPGGVIRLQINSYVPLAIDVQFARDFQLMWPASIGTSYGEWNAPAKALFFGADGQPYAAVLGSPDAALSEREYGTNYSSGSTNTFTLGTFRKGSAERFLAFSGSVKSRDEALAVYRSLSANVPAIIAAAERHDRDYLARTVTLDLPDRELQAAYDWSKLSMGKGMVENPLVGTGLVAGYGPSKGVYRPGFAWFFGRDTFWTTFALTSAGDLAAARTAIEFIAKYQSLEGKIPHEISQSASLVPWFDGYPYGYASADATPLYIAAVRNYVQASGDMAFAQAQLPRLRKAFDFMRAHFETNGFPRNFGVGHGWIEGGPLLPIEVELYQAGCYLEALRSMSVISRLTGGTDAASFDAEFEAKRKLLEQRFWLPASGTYAFALDRANQPVDQPTVLSTVPMWFGLLDPARSLQMIEKLSEEQHAADWGMRIISRTSPTYSPEGYHYGSVWPLFTGWASTGEYRYHAASTAFSNLKANAWLSLDGAAGNPTEVLSGMTYSPLSTASPHQIWSAAMVVSPLLRGLCGLEVDAPSRQVIFAPHIPADWPRLGIRNVAIGNSLLDFSLVRDEKTLSLKVLNHGAETIRIDFAPAYNLSARVTGAASEDRSATDLHPHFLLEAKPGESSLTIQHEGVFGYSVPYQHPQLGAESSNLKVISERWPSKSEMQLVVSGLASREYRLIFTGRVASIVGAKQEGSSLVIDMPPGNSYVKKTITIRPE